MLEECISDHGYERVTMKAQPGLFLKLIKPETPIECSHKLDARDKGRRFALHPDIRSIDRRSMPNTFIPLALKACLGRTIECNHFENRDLMPIINLFHRKPWRDVTQDSFHFGFTRNLIKHDVA
jgi:hypothetical protein